MVRLLVHLIGDSHQTHAQDSKPFAALFTSLLSRLSTACFGRVMNQLARWKLLVSWQMWTLQYMITMSERGEHFEARSIHIPISWSYTLCLSLFVDRVIIVVAAGGNG